MKRTLESSVPKLKLSYNEQVPSIGMKLLLVGPNNFTQPLAAALLSIRFDHQPSYRKDVAMEAIRKHAFSSLPARKRHVHTIESLTDTQGPNWNFRMDHIVFLVTPSDYEDSISNNDDSSPYRYNTTIQDLADDYRLMERVSTVVVHESTEQQFRTKMPQTPVFHMHLDSSNSHLAVARMLLQRCRLGTRDGQSVLSKTSPLLFSLSSA